MDRPPARRALLALSVLDDVDVDPAGDGFALRSPLGVEVLLSAAEVAAAVGGHDPEGDDAVAALRAWAGWRFALADEEPGDLVGRARPVGLPRGHVLHPGPAWVLRPVLGGHLDLGLGLRGAPDDPEAVEVLHPVMAEAIGLTHDAAVERAVRYLDDMAELAADRHRRDPVAPLRPLGDADVVTLLASERFRTALVSVDPSGMRTAAVPMRTRGWLDLGRLDPAFALAAAACTDPADRGFERPVLLTREEVVVVRDGGRAGAFGASDALRSTPGRLPA